MAKSRESGGLRYRFDPQVGSSGCDSGRQPDSTSGYNWKNRTFLGSDGGGRTAAVLSSVTGTCKHHDINPFAYLQDILRRLPSHPADQLDELLADVWFASHPSARRKRAA
jgi:hypothetical protein